MTTTLADASRAVDLWSPAAKLEHAQNLAKSTLVNAHFRNAHNILFAAEIGRAYGLEPAVAIRNIHVFDSSEGVKTAISADLMVTLARNAGHTVHIVSTPGRVTGTLIRGDFTKERVANLTALGYSLEEIRAKAEFTEVWDQKRAMEAGLLSKQNWQKYIEDMLRSRVKSGLVRLAASECLMGVMYTPDELGADTDRTGIPLEGSHVIVGETVPNAPAARGSVTVTRTAVSPQKPIVVEAEVEDAEVEDAEVEDTTTVETDEEESAEVAKPDPQAVADYALSVVNGKGGLQTKLKTIHGLVRQVGEYEMNDETVTVGDNTPTLSEALDGFARFLLEQAKKTAKKAEPAAA